MNDKQFRFQELEIWKRAAVFSLPLFQLADRLETRRLFRFAEQLRGATLSITNNIAEGSGSVSKIDFANFLNTARRSTF
jgi:four helix bundle protein